MKNDGQRDQHYFVYFNLKKNKEKSRVNDNCLIHQFSKVQIQTVVTYFIKVNRASVNAILNLKTREVTNQQK